MRRQIWKSRLLLKWQFGLLLILLFGIPRFMLVLQANVTGNYNLIPLIFILMALTPYLLLSKDGRFNTGIKKPAHNTWLLYSFMIGIGICTITFMLAHFLFDYSTENWFVYISNTYAVPTTGLTSTGRLIYFIIYALIGMTFSPVGEELFYRGIVHGSFTDKFGEHGASIIDSAAFALTHLAHFGIVYLSGTWQFLLGPALIWMTMIYIAGRLFFFCKQRSGSILGAILCHAGFNLSMMYFIFYYIL
ncbi:CPBP family intramembrane glutamic endopeptidase [Pedobacter immunditicola]|uniref:CPBP family intramembrane glutamic endopeptidase n=1 Tax=Pedobacter immunditicola TaxID=3133440 RepID=UPI0030B6EAE0